jgi:hypothetical protein
MTQVMRQCNGLNQVFVESQVASNGATQLSDFQRMGQPRAEEIALVVQKNLSFVNQPAKSRRVHDPVAVTLKSRARGCRQFGITTPARKFWMASIRGQQHYISGKAARVLDSDA